MQTRDNRNEYQDVRYNRGAVYHQPTGSYGGSASKIVRIAPGEPLTVETFLLVGNGADAVAIHFCCDCGSRQIVPLDEVAYWPDAIPDETRPYRQEDPTRCWRSCSVGGIDGGGVPEGRRLVD